MLRKLTAVLCLGLLVLGVPVLAQDAAAGATPADASGPTGITTLVILAGLGAMLVVGGLIYMKENSKSGKEVD